MTRRAFVVSYAGMAVRPSRTVSGEFIVEAAAIHTAASRAVTEIVRRERLVSQTRVRSLNLRITKGGTIA